MNKISIIAMVCLLAVFSCGRPTPSAGNNDSISLEEAQVTRSVDSHEAKLLLEEDKEVILLDVRTPEEYGKGHLAGAKNLDFHGADFVRQLQILNPDQKYMVYCAVGGRSGKTMKIMEEMGFKQVYNVTEGFAQLSEKGIPLEEGDRE